MPLRVEQHGYAPRAERGHAGDEYRVFAQSRIRRRHNHHRQPEANGFMEHAERHGSATAVRRYPALYPRPAWLAGRDVDTETVGSMVPSGRIEADLRALPVGGGTSGRDPGLRAGRVSIVDGGGGA